MFFHELARIGEFHVWGDGDGSAGCDVSGSHLDRILPFGQDSDHNVSIRNQSNGLLTLDNGNHADVF